VERSVTVVITTRNRRDLLQEAVRSVLVQRPFLVIVDDASSDDTSAWLSDQRGDDVTVEALSTRVGLPAARNVGLAHVHTPFVLFLDDDDLLMGGALARLAVLLDRYPSAVAAVGGRVRFGADGPIDAAPAARREFARAIHRDVVFGWAAISGQTLFRRSALMAAGRWNAAYDRVAEDQELWLRLSLLGPVAFHPGPVLWNRVHSGQARPDDVRQVEDRMREAHVRTSVAASCTRDRSIVTARAHQLRAIDCYGAGQPSSAIPPLLVAVMRAPWIMSSPVTRRSAWGLLGRCVAASILGRRFLGRLRQARGSVRRAIS